LDLPLSNVMPRERFLPWAFAIGCVQLLDLKNCWIFRLRQDKICTTSHTGTSASAPLAAGVCALALSIADIYILLSPAPLAAGVCVPVLSLADTELKTPAPLAADCIRTGAKYVGYSLESAHFC